MYLGLSDFNARARAVNFTPEKLPEVQLNPLTSCTTGAAQHMLGGPNARP